MTLSVVGSKNSPPGIPGPNDRWVQLPGSDGIVQQLLLSNNQFLLDCALQLLFLSRFPSLQLNLNRAFCGRFSGARFAAVIKMKFLFQRFPFFRFFLYSLRVERWESHHRRLPSALLVHSISFRLSAFSGSES
jgi:hypothetical protein